MGVWAGDRDRRRGRDRPAARRHPHRVLLVAVDLLRQHPRRHRRLPALAAATCPSRATNKGTQGFDVAGAVTVTAGLIALVYTIVNAQVRLGVAHTLGFGTSRRPAHRLRPDRQRSAEPLVRLTSSACGRSAPRTSRCSWSPRGCLRCSSSTPSTYSGCSISRRSRRASHSFPHGGISSAPRSHRSPSSASASARLPIIGMSIATVGMSLLLMTRARTAPTSRMPHPGLIPISIGMGLTFVPVTLLADERRVARGRRPRVGALQYLAAGGRRARARHPVHARGQPDTDVTRHLPAPPNTGPAGRGARDGLPRGVLRRRALLRRRDHRDGDDTQAARTSSRSTPTGR